MSNINFYPILNKNIYINLSCNDIIKDVRVKNYFHKITIVFHCKEIKKFELKKMENDFAVSMLPSNLVHVS